MLKKKLEFPAPSLRTRFQTAFQGFKISDIEITAEDIKRSGSDPSLGLFPDMAQEMEIS